LGFAKQGGFGGEGQGEKQRERIMSMTEQRKNPVFSGRKFGYSKRKRAIIFPHSKGNRAFQRGGPKKGERNRNGEKSPSISLGGG